MGKSDSKLGGVSYDEAARKASEDELARLRNAFKRASHAGYMNKSLFAREVLTDAVPPQLALQIYEAVATSNRGVSQRELISFLVLLSCGTTEQRMKLLYSICSRDGETVTQPALDGLIVACDGKSPQGLAELFESHPRSKKSGQSSRHQQLQSEISDTVDFEKFSNWARKHYKSVSFMHWLLGEEPGTQPCLSDNSQTPTFYQVLAGMTHLNDTEVAELERRYWQLKASSKTGKLDLETLTPSISPPLPLPACAGLYAAIDTNSDGHLDFKEMCCAISTCCLSENDQEQFKFCFRVFDIDRDGVLNTAEQASMFNTLALITYANVNGTGSVPSDEVLANLVAKLEDNLKTTLNNETEIQALSVEDYCTWAKSSSVPQDFLKLLVEICHICLGLRPRTPTEEGCVVRRWIARDQLLGFKVDSTLHLVSRQWFNMWLEHTNSPIPASHGRGGTSSSTSHLVVGGVSDANAPHHASNTRGSTSSPAITASSPVESKAMATEYTAVSVSRSKEATTPEGDGCLPQPSRASLGKTRSSTRSNPKNSSGSGSGSGSGGVGSSSSSTGGGSAVVSTKSTNTDSADLDDSSTSGLGPIDNSVLCTTDSRKMSMIITSEGGQLKRGLHIDRDFTYVTEPVWRALCTWYNGGPSLPRTVIQGPSGPGLELYMYSIKFYRHTTNPNLGRSSTAGHAMSHLSTFWSWAVSMLGTSSGTSSMTAYYPTSAAVSSSSAHSSGAASSAAVSQPPLPRRYLAYYASLSRKLTLTQLEEFIQQKMFLKPDDFRLWQMKEDSPTTLLEDSTISLERLQLDGKSLLLEVRNKDLTWPEEILSLAAAAKSKKEEKKKSTSSSHVERGTTGLSNLGNTCFLNSAVQSLSNTQPLSMYFCANKHLDELNRSNPMGMKGHVAKRYGDLVHDLWSGTSKSIAPLKLRWTIARYATQFNTFQQQDAQELLAFLLDGLHEDLNRIEKKPYVELQDSDGREDTVVAQEAWDYHLKRNFSVIVDMFHGQLKSSLRCLECGHTNNRFDPFTFLSLPLPMENTVYLEVIMVRLDGSVPVRYAFRLNPESRYVLLKTELSNLTQVAPNQLLLVEIFASSLRNVLVESNKLRQTLSGLLYAFEVPKPSAIEPTASCASVDRLHAVQRLQTLAPTRTSNSLSPTDCAPASTTTTTTAGTSADGDVASNGSDSAGNGSAGAAAATATAADGLDTTENGHHRTRAEPTSNEPTEDSKATRHHALAPPSAATATSCAASNDLTSPIQSALSPQAHHGDVVDDEYVHVDTDSSVSSPPLPGAAAAATATSAVLSNASPVPAVAAGTSPCVAASTTSEFDGFIFAFHRKSFLSDIYFLAHGKSKPGIFGIPVAVPWDKQTTHLDLYRSLSRQLKRFIASPDPDAAVNENDYPFVLKSVRKDGLLCSQCPWWKFCSGCTIVCDETSFDSVATRYIAIDWDSTALHLRYQNAQERAMEEHESIKKCQESLTEAISLEECLAAFTKEEELGEDDPWYCSKCKKHQRAVKKLDIWKLPPILVVHVKRFQFVNGQWVKSQKAVKFPASDFSPPSLSPNYLQQQQQQHGSSRSQSPDSDSMSAATTQAVGRGSTASSSLPAKATNGSVAPNGNGLSSAVVPAVDSSTEAVPALPASAESAGTGTELSAAAAGTSSSTSTAGDTHAAAAAADATQSAVANTATTGSSNSNVPVEDALPSSQDTSEMTPAAAATTAATSSDECGITNPLASLSSPVAVESDPLNDEVALQGIAKTIQDESLKDRLGGGDKIDEQTLSLAKLNDASASASAGATASSAAAVASSTSADTPTCASPSQSSVSSRKSRTHPTMAERLGKAATTPDQTDETYNLYAMTTHQGYLGVGHYVTFACNPNGNWYCYNDSSCKEIERTRVEDESPYLLFYESSSIDYNKFLRHAKRRANNATAGNSLDEEDELDREMRNGCSIM
ncbi:ubiquitin carboxyl-terminal hydrolase 32-like [Sycon ciliatum]|uniref:ubiquitin carboxyl-terminal hydrolase 32-like n=1 Tax=Sycon ciliatum TaxID=27933 RepID=UPI0031F62F1E